MAAPVAQGEEASLIDSGLLLGAFVPAEPWAERGVGYRQWRLLKGETAGSASAAAGSTSKFTDAADLLYEPPRSDLNASDFNVDHVLGDGNYSQVFQATLRSTQHQIALKVVDKAKCKRYKKEDEVLVERWVLRNIEHPSIIAMYHTFQEVAALYLALELCPGGELWALSHKVGLPFGLARFYAAQMLEVLQYLHERDVVHRDVKPENVLLTATGHIKVIDFGTAKLLRHPIKLNADTEADNKGARRGKFKEFVGTPEYMSPEAINNQYATQRADLWSFGVFIAQIVTGWPCFKGGSDYLTFKRVLARKYRLPEGTPLLAESLIEQLCVVAPKERLGGAWTAEADSVDPTTLKGTEPRTGLGHAAIRAHPFFAEYPQLELWKVKCPTLSAAEEQLIDLVKKIDDAKGVSALGATADDQARTVAGWSEEWKRAVTFECGKRNLLTPDVRALFGLGEPLPPLEDDLEEFNKDESDEDATAAGDDDDAGPASDDDEERRAAADEAAGREAKLGSKSGESASGVVV